MKDGSIITHITKTARIELHAAPKTAARNKALWEKVGFKTKIYFVTEGEDTLTGLEITI